MGRKLFWLFLLGLLGLWAEPASAADVRVWGEGAYTDTDVQVNIYVGTPLVLRSFGVKLDYNPVELVFDANSTRKNEESWYFGEGGNKLPYVDPKSVNDAVVIVGGKLDANAPGEGVTGDRVLVATVWFARPQGSGGPLFSVPTLSLAKTGYYQNFVTVAGEALDGTGVGLEPVGLFERGDANGDGYITNTDYFKIRSLMQDNIYCCYADCNNDGYITNTDFFCIRNKMF